MECEDVMQRLISLFQEPEDPWPSLAEPREQRPASALKREPRDPLYFVELLAYLRDRNREVAAQSRMHSPREGAD